MDNNFIKDILDLLKKHRFSVPSKPGIFSNRTTEAQWDRLANEAESHAKQLENLEGSISSDIEYASKAFSETEVDVKVSIQAKIDEIYRKYDDKFRLFKEYRNEIEKKNVLDLQNYIPTPLTYVPTLLHVGFLVGRDDSNRKFPVYINFFSEEKDIHSKPPNSIMVKVDNKTETRGLAFMRALIQQMYLKMPLNSNVRIVDTTGSFSRSISFFKEIGVLKPESDTPFSDIMYSIKTIANNNALSDSEPFISKFENPEKNENLLKIENLEFIAICDDFNSFSYRDGDGSILSILKNGGKSGKYVVFLYNVDNANNREIRRTDIMEQCSNCIEFDFTSEIFIKKGYDFKEIGEIPNDILGRLEKSIKTAKDNKKAAASIVSDETKIKWDEYSAEEMVECTVGEDSNGRPLNVWFGERNGGSELSVHAGIFGTTGSGKSNFFHSMILNMAERYSPEELRFYLIDGKDGTTFTKYRNLPHSAAVSLDKSSDMAISVLELLTSEQKRRHGIMNASGCSKYSDYRRFCVANNKEHNMPRIILLIDEFGVLFEDVTRDRAARLLTTLCAQGRSAGIHVLLSSQGPRTIDMPVTKDALYRNVTGKIIFGLVDPNGDGSFWGMPRSQIKLLEDVSIPLTPGKVYINQSGGEETAKTGMIYKFQTDHGILEKRIEILKKEAETKTSASYNCLDLRSSSQVKFLGNETVKSLLNGKTIAEIAQEFVINGGLEIPNWNLLKNPIVSWMGEGVGVSSSTNLILQSDRDENIYIAGKTSYARNAILSSLAIGFAINDLRKKPDFYFFDNSIFDSKSQYDALEKTSNLLSSLGFCSIHVRRLEDVKEGIKILADECKRRMKILEEDKAARFDGKLVFISDLNSILSNFEMDRNKRDNPFLNDMLYLVCNGAQCCINIAISSDALVSLRVFGMSRGRKEFLSCFNHMILLALRSEDIDREIRKNASRFRVSQEQIEMLSRNQIAYYMTGDEISKFKPYIISETWDEEFDSISKAIKESFANG